MWVRKFHSPARLKTNVSSLANLREAKNKSLGWEQRDKHRSLQEEASRAEGAKLDFNIFFYL